MKGMTLFSEQNNAVHIANSSTQENKTPQKQGFSSQPI